MKFIFCIAFTLIGISTKAQSIVTGPTIHYLSSWTLEELNGLPVGMKILFVQNCDPNIAPEIPNGVVMFQNVFHNKEKLSVAIEFKDTVVECVTYYINANQKDVLKSIGLSDIKHQSSINKGEWTFSNISKDVAITVVGDKKKIVVIKRRNLSKTTG